jgi:hypothetical protein
MMLVSMMLFLSTLAQAEENIPAIICSNPQQLMQTVDSCPENESYVDAAEKCLDKLHNESAKLGIAMKSGFSKKSGKQSQNFSAANQDYNLTVANLRRMIAIAGKAGDEVDAYLDTIILPEDTFTMGEEDPDAYAMEMPCFGEAREALISIVEDIEKMEDDLDAALAVATAHGNLSAGSEQKVEALQPGTVLKKKAPLKGNEKGKDGSKSNVSGTKKLELKKP